MVLVDQSGFWLFVLALFGAVLARRRMGGFGAGVFYAAGLDGWAFMAACVFGLEVGFGGRSFDLHILCFFGFVIVRPRKRAGLKIGRDGWIRHPWHTHRPALQNVGGKFRGVFWKTHLASVAGLTPACSTTQHNRGHRRKAAAITVKRSTAMKGRGNVAGIGVCLLATRNAKTRGCNSIKVAPRC